MGSGDQLRTLLRPLGVYDLTPGSLSDSELEALGRGLDGVCGRLDDVEREGSLATAEGEGLDRLEALFARTPVHYSTELRRQAIAALLRISGDCFTLTAINDTISGCGVPAVVKELGKGQVSVSFPGIAGEPQGFQSLKEIIEDILPAHLGIEYDFWFLTWQELEDNFPSWQSIEDLELSWTRLETFVEFL